MKGVTVNNVSPDDFCTFAANYTDVQLAPMAVDARAHARAGLSKLHGAYINGTLVGIASEHVGQLEYLLVHPEYRRRGVALALLDAMSEGYPVLVPTSLLDVMLDGLPQARLCEGGHLYTSSNKEVHLMYTIEMGYKLTQLRTAVQYTQENRAWNVIKNSNAEEMTATKSNKLFVIQTPLQRVSITCQEMVNMLTGVMDAYYTLVNAACESGVFDAQYYADNILPGEVERFSTPTPAMSFPTTYDALPILMHYMGQTWRFDRIHRYWWPLNGTLDYNNCNNHPTFTIDPAYAADSVVPDMTPSILIGTVADIINCFTSLDTINKAGVYNYALLEG